MERTKPNLRNASIALTLVSLMSPFYALAGYISANVSASTINSLGEFQVTMTSSGMTSCTWSRLDNGTTWQWKDEPLPSGTSYDSGVLSGWAGAADYEWQFNCADGLGGSYFAATAISISSEPSTISSSLTSVLASVVSSVLSVTTSVSATEIPLITVVPNPINFGAVTIGTPQDINLTVTNSGGSSSLLSGSVSLSGDPEFTCTSGCVYSNLPSGPGHNVTIHFEPTSTIPKNTIITFSGGGGTVIPGSGSGVPSSVVVVASPVPVISVSPSPTLNYYGVEVGDYLDKHFYVSNIGPTGTLLSGILSITGDSSYSCISGCTYVNIATTDSPKEVTIRFHPTAGVGTKIATLHFTGGGDTTRFVNGDAILLSIEKTLDFNNVIVGREKSMTLQITNPSSVTNVGTGSLIVPPPFYCIGVCTYNLPPNGSQSFQITFTPTYPGQATVIGSLSNYPSSAITLKGNGVRQYFRMNER